MRLKEIVAIMLGLASVSAPAQTGVDYVLPGSDRPMPAPMTHIEPKQENGIIYLCGGVGEEESTAMKQAALDYDLMMTFAASNGSYLAGVKVEIADARGRPLLRTSCDAPIMLVDFEESGTYRIRARANGHSVTSRTQVRVGRKVRTIAMTWPVTTVEMGRSPIPGSEQSSGSSGDAGRSDTGAAGTR